VRPLAATPTESGTDQTWPSGRSTGDRVGCHAASSRQSGLGGPPVAPKSPPTAQTHGCSVEAIRLLCLRGALFRLNARRASQTPRSRRDQATIPAQAEVSCRSKAACRAGRSLNERTGSRALDPTTDQEVGRQMPTTKRLCPRPPRANNWPPTRRALAELDESRSRARRLRRPTSRVDKRFRQLAKSARRRNLLAKSAYVWLGIATVATVTAVRSIGADIVRTGQQWSAASAWPTVSRGPGSHRGLQRRQRQQAALGCSIGHSSMRLTRGGPGNCVTILNLCAAGGGSCSQGCPCSRPPVSRWRT